MATTPIARTLPFALGGMSLSEHEALAQAHRGLPGVEFVPTIDDRRARRMSGGTGTNKFFVGNTRLAPFTGQWTKSRDAVTVGVGVGGPCGIAADNSGESCVYAGYTTAYNTGGAHAGGHRIKFYLRTNVDVVLEPDTQYHVVVYQNVTMRSSGRLLPAPEDATGCYQFDVYLSGSGYAGATLTGAANESPYLDLTLDAAPTLAGYTGLALTAGGGDLVFIYQTPAVRGNDEHELVWTATKAFVGPRGIWWPYNGFQRASQISSPTALVQGVAPVPAASLQTEHNWYLRPTVQFAPEQLCAGQSFDFCARGDVSGNTSTTEHVLELLMFFSNAEENGWDAGSDSWFDPGPYGAFSAATWDEGTLTLTAVGSGIGDLGAAALWVLSGTNAVAKAYHIASGSGDSVTLDVSLQSGGAASDIAGYVGGIDVSHASEPTALIVGGSLQRPPVLAFQSTPFEWPGSSRSLEIDVKVTSLDVSNTANNSAGIYQVATSFYISSGQGSSAGALFDSGEPAHLNNRKLINVTIQTARLNPVTERLGVTFLLKLALAEHATDLTEHLVPGVHGYAVDLPYDPETGLGAPLVFTESTPSSGIWDTLSGTLRMYPNDGTNRLRLTQWDANYKGSSGG